MSKKIWLCKALTIGVIVMIGIKLVLILIVFSTERAVNYKISRSIEAKLEGVEKRGGKIYLNWESAQSTLQGGFIGWGGSQFSSWVESDKSKHIFPSDIIGRYLRRKVRVVYKLSGKPPNHFLDVDDNRLRGVKVLSFEILE